MRAHIVRDSSTTPFSAFEVGWLPPWAFAHVTPIASRDGRGVALRAGPSVGAIPLNNGDVLWIVPRAGRAQFWRMLQITEGLDQAVRAELQDEAAIGVENEGHLSLTSALARPFLNRLIEIERRSLAPRRKRTTEWLNHARGAIAPLETTLAVARGDSRSVLSTYWHKTYNSPEHRVLGAAAMQLLALDEVSIDLRPVAARWAQWVSRKKLAVQELQKVVVSLSRDEYSGTRAYYGPALAMARMILSQSNLTFDERQISAAQPVLTSMPLLFQRYVQCVIGEELTPLGFAVEKVERGIRALPLFLDGTAQLLPDILISHSGTTRFIVDAKYKPGHTPDTADYYQLAAYLGVYGCTSGALILPAADGDLCSSTTTRQLRDGSTIHEVHLALPSVQEAENYLQAFVRDAVK